MTRQYATMLKEFLLLKGGRIRSRENAMENAATLRRADWIRDTDALATAHDTIRNNDPRQKGRLM